MAENSTNGNLHLTSGGLLARNTIWNLVGNGAPLIVALFSIPILIHGLGKDRFGVLALAWALIGYASLFDIGLGRALTQLVAKKLGSGDDHDVPRLVWTSLLLMLLLGLVGAAAIVVISPWLVRHALKIPEALQSESLRAFYLLGLSVPVVIVTAGLRGLLEAHQRFKLVNALRIPIGVFTFVGPLLVLPFSRSLLPVVGILVVGRFAGCFAHLLACFRVVPELRQRVAWHGPSAGPLLRFGGWMTVSNIVGPLMVSVDRFFIAGFVSVAAVTYYATPFEVVTKLWVVSTAISGVMFPAFSLCGALSSDRTSILYRRTMKYTVAILVGLTTILLFGARAGLSLWLGPDFAAQSFRITQLLLIGTCALGIAALPFALIQGLGRPDIPAKLNLVEIPLYLGVLYWSVRNFGVVGAATTWMLRATIDGLLLVYFAHNLQRKPFLGLSAELETSVLSVND
jgi:O-antigen/teichoic acid export membrane protein